MTFTFNLCDQVLREDKHHAIPQVLRVSKYKNIIEAIMKSARGEDETKYRKSPKNT